MTQDRKQALLTAIAIFVGISNVLGICGAAFLFVFQVPAWVANVNDAQRSMVRQLQEIHAQMSLDREKQNEINQKFVAYMNRHDAYTTAITGLEIRDGYPVDGLKAVKPINEVITNGMNRGRS